MSWPDNGYPRVQCVCNSFSDSLRLSLSAFNDHLVQMNVKCTFKTSLANFLARLNAWAPGAWCSWDSARSVHICRLSTQRASRSPSRAAWKGKKWCGLGFHGFHHQCTLDVFNLQCNQLAWRSRSFETFSSIGKKRWLLLSAWWWMAEL